MSQSREQQPRRPGTLREQQRTFTRERLKSAAVELLADRGYLRTTVEDIAANADASRATFYLHFSGKVDIVKALIGDRVSHGVDNYKVLDQMLVTADDVDRRGALRNWLQAALEVWCTRERLQVSLMQAAANEPEIEAEQIAILPTLIDSLENAPWKKMTSGSEAGRARDRALMVAFMTQRIWWLTSVHLLDVDRDTMLDFITDMWDQILFPIS
jgi:AcrR family transcriptional regulator